MSNLLEKASIVLTPTAYSDSTLHSIKPLQTLGSELVTNGGFDTDSNWVKGTGWTISGGTANQDGSNGILRQNNVTSTNTKVKVTFDLTNYGGSGNLQVKIAPNIYALTLTGNGSYTVFTDGTNSTNGDVQIITNSGFVGSIDNVSVKEVIDADFNFTRSTTGSATGIGSRENSSGNIESVAADLARIDYLGGTAHILLEPQSTNITQNSEQPATWHSSGNVTITANATTSPDGTTNSSLVVVNSSSGSIYTRARLVFSSGSGTQTVTASCFLKYYNNQWVRLKSAFFTGSPAQNERSFFDIQNGVLGTVSTNHTAKIEDYGNGWYRCSITFDIDKDQDDNGYMQVEPMSGDNTNTYASIGQGFYGFGSQGEELSFMTSYIPTGSSSVTRSQDEANNSGSTDLINSTEGVLYAELSVLNTASTVRTISISDGSISNSVEIIYLSSGSFGFRIRANNAVEYLQASALSDATQFVKAAISYKSGDIKCFINGSEFNTDTTSFSFTNSLSELAFDRGNGQNDFQGKVKCVAVFKEALTDAQLTALTT